MTDRAALIAEAKTLTWFHSIDFGDYVSPARTPARTVPNGTLQPIWEFVSHIDVTGLRCLDLGTADGIVAFTLKQRGARRVVATDGVNRRPFEVARKLLALDVEYIDDLYDEDISHRFEPQSFDLIVMAGLLYHLFAPLRAVAACRNLLRPGGLLLTETCYTGGEEPAAYLNTETDPPYTQQWSTYWIPTPSCIEGMLKLSCFDVLGSASLGPLAPKGGIGRIGHVARAVSPDDVADRKPQLVSTHTKLKAVPEINFDYLRQQAENHIPYTGSRAHVEIPASHFPDGVPLLPSLKRLAS